MGRFVNPDNSAFKSSLNARIYVDKSGLISFTNSILSSPDAFICNSRPRRFGKSITANMLAAYYSKGADSREMVSFMKGSENILEATLTKDCDKVAQGIEKLHDEYASNLKYNDENSLSNVLPLAYLASMNRYFKPIRELPAGKGFADFVYIPKPEFKEDYPALVVELKWNKDAKTALDQIKEKNYPDSIKDYTDNILLVGINYDKTTKQHECLIENFDGLMLESC